MKRIMKSGTFKDKVSALSIYIQDNPRYSLKTLESLVDMCSQRGKKDQLVVFMALKDIFEKVYKDSEVRLEPFQQGMQRVNSNDKHELARVYLGDQVRKQLKKFLEVGRRLLMDELLFVRETATKALIGLLDVEDDSVQSEYLMATLINKLGDKDKKYVKMLMN